MAVSGVMPLSHYQAAIEATYGTILAATRRQPMLEGGFLKEHFDRHYVKEQRGTFIDNYRSYVTKRHVELAGLPFAQTFEDLPWFLQGFAAGGVGSAKTLSTSAAADDIIDCVGHGFVENDPVIFTSLTGGTGLTAGTRYYVIAANLATDTFQVSATVGGSAVNFSSDITAGSVRKHGVGGGAGDAGSPEMYTYTFTPAATLNDLQPVNWEVADDTQNFSVAGCIGQSLELSYDRESGVAGATASYLGQRAVAQAVTGSLSDRTVEDINAALFVAYIDSTTIGSTLYAYPLSFKFSMENGYSPLFVGDSNLYPKEFIRGAKRHVKLEATLAFDSIAEYNAYAAGTERKIRLRVNGSTIHDAVTKRLDIDWYGPYAEQQFGSQGGLKTTAFSAESQYNASAGWDWRIAIQNALPALP